jgi:hypothetical protein
MSTRHNNNLERVRSLNSYPIKTPQNRSISNEQKATNNTLVSPVLHPSPHDDLYATKYITEHTDGYSRRSTARVYDSPFKTEPDMTIHQLYQQQQQQTAHRQSNSFDPNLTIPAQIPRSVKTAIRLPGPEVVARLIEPNIAPNTTYQRAFKDVSYHESALQTQNSNLHRLPTKDNDQSFTRSSKQRKLLDLQDRWSKTQAQRQYHLAHPEVVPDVGGNTIRAKKEILIADAIAKRGIMTVR